MNTCTQQRFGVTLVNCFNPYFEDLILLHSCTKTVEIHNRPHSIRMKMVKNHDAGKQVIHVKAE
jgi:hypothetical protein